MRRRAGGRQPWLASRTALDSLGAMPCARLHPSLRRLAAVGRRAGWVAALAVLVAWAPGCATAPRAYREPAALAPAARAAHNARVFDRAWALVEAKYFDAKFRGVDWVAAGRAHRAAAVAAADEEALYAVLNRMAATLKESHLAAFPPRRAHEQRTAHRPGVGMSWRVVEGQRVILEVVPGGPAARAGVRPGWLALERDGRPLADEGAYTPRLGERVTYAFLDPAEVRHELTLEPELLEFERRESRPLAGGWVYLRFDRFSLGELAWLSRELKAARAAPGVVLDLRDNPGGSALALRAAVAEFFPHAVEEGKLITRTGRVRTARSWAWRPARYAGRVVILTEGATGSAAEIFAHVLQFHGRATVVGRPTAGAVIYSRSYALPGGGRLQVPVVDYVGLDGARLEGRGVTPDRVVPAATLAERRAGLDPDLAAALEVARGER